MSEEQNIDKELEQFRVSEKADKQETVNEKPKVAVEKQLETANEQDLEQQGEQQKELSEQISSMTGESAAATATAPVSVNKEREKQIENFLATGLEDMYLGMDTSKRKEFKEAGEKTAQEINNLMEKTKLNVKKVVDLIKKWLMIIPGVNKFFLEQEAKLRADKIMQIKK